MVLSMLGRFVLSATGLLVMKSFHLMPRIRLWHVMSEPPQRNKYDAYKSHDGVVEYIYQPCSVAYPGPRVVLFSIVFVCLFANKITPESLRDIITKFQGIILWPKGRSSSKMLNVYGGGAVADLTVLFAIVITRPS